MAVKCQIGKQYLIYIYIMKIKLSEPIYHNIHIYKSIQYINIYCNFQTIFFEEKYICISHFILQIKEKIVINYFFVNVVLKYKHIQIQKYS